MAYQNITSQRDWAPTSHIDTLRERARILNEIRRFFTHRNVMEVETPALSQCSVTDPFLIPFKTRFVGPAVASGIDLFMQTSPEYAMKRLLAAGSGCIYQISKAFRNEESGRFHNPEFTLLEWYRVGFDDVALMNEIEELIHKVLGIEQCERKTYQEAFYDYVGVDPLEATESQLTEALKTLGMESLIAGGLSRDDMLQLLFSEYVEPNIGQSYPCFIYNFPSSQAALARINATDSRVAHRFELYFKGIELANGFYELTDSAEQRKRFEKDNQKRLQLGFEEQLIDERFMSALDMGLPECSGVALGIDRLVMLALGVETIQEAIAFPIQIA